MQTGTQTLPHRMLHKLLETFVMYNTLLGRLRQTNCTHSMHAPLLHTQLLESSVPQVAANFNSPNPTSCLCTVAQTLERHGQDVQLSKSMKEQCT